VKKIAENQRPGLIGKRFWREFEGIAVNKNLPAKTSDVLRGSRKYVEIFYPSP
jgi:hypothetical protein